MTWEGPHVTEVLESSQAPKKRSGGLNTMLLADLKAMAGGMGIAGAGSMKKADLVTAIKAAQAKPKSDGAPKANDAPADRPKDEAKPKADEARG